MAKVILRYEVTIHKEKEFEVPAEIIQKVKEVDERWVEAFYDKMSYPGRWEKVCEEKNEAIDELEEYVNYDEIVNAIDEDYNYVDFLEIIDENGDSLVSW